MEPHRGSAWGFMGGFTEQVNVPLCTTIYIYIYDFGISFDSAGKIGHRACIALSQGAGCGLCPIHISIDQIPHDFKKKKKKIEGLLRDI